MNIEIVTIQNVIGKPKRCVKCGNNDLMFEVLKAKTGNPSQGISVVDVNNAYCSNCKTLMIYSMKPPI